MAVCLHCNDTVDEAHAPHWGHEDTTFYFCSSGCEQQVKAEPEKWLEVARSGHLRGDAPHNGHHRH